jgi:hypothetical protein
VDVDIWVLVDADGNAVSSCNRDDLTEAYQEAFGSGLLADTPTRVICVKLDVSLPTVTVLTPAASRGVLVAN